ISASNLAGNIGVIDRYVVLNKVPRGSYYYTITAVNASGEYIVERHSFTVSDEPTTSTLVPESEGGVICENGAVCPQLSYKDMLPATHWAHDSVDFVLKNGYFLGNGNGYFLPTTDMSRAMAVTVLHRIAESATASLTDEDSHELQLHEEDECTCTCTCDACTSGKPEESTGGTSTSGGDHFEPVGSGFSDNLQVSTGESGSSSADGADDEPEEVFFTDVEAGSWYEEHVTWAHENGIVQGKSEGIFDPNGTVSRSELATLMYRLAEHLGLSTEYTDTTASFADGATLADWERDGLAFAVSAGLIGGSPRGDELYLDGVSFATREQVSAILYRFVSLGK
ncbi:MAG: S-layer homology domain-containing protein, partial [Clostridia bacterium]|nr:S-layer homology domain-containing protein [Clostridia bacterium]